MGCMRRPFPLLLPILALPAAAGCGEPKKLTCDRSVAQACATAGSCALTWEQAQDDRLFCPVARSSPPHRIECGSYHAVTVSEVDASTTFYYDAASGMLVAIVQAGLGGTACTAGPAGGFTRPTCGGAVSEPLPQCLDGGADARTTD
jgi:hypothetical protein